MSLKTWLTATTAALLLNLPMPAVMAHSDHGKAQLGGVVAEAGEAQFEIVARDGKITVHATDHGKPLAMTGATGKLTVLAGTVKSELALKAAGDNRLAGEGSLGKGAKLLLSVQMPSGKTVQARAVAP